MHEVSKEEQEKRGCKYCTKLSRIRKMNDGKIGSTYNYMCLFKKCPYRDLDEYDTYDEYLESLGIVLYIEEE